MHAIPQPSVLPGDVVSVENYRMRPAHWEHGYCMGAKYHVIALGIGGFSGRWQYEVILNRRSPKDHPIRLYVGDGQVERDD